MRVKRADKLILFTSDKQLHTHLSIHYRIVGEDTQFQPLFIIIDGTNRYRHLDVFSLLLYLFGYLYFKLGQYVLSGNHCYIIVIMKPRVLKISLLEKRLIIPLSKLYRLKRYTQKSAIQNNKNLSALMVKLGKYYRDKGHYKVAVYKLMGGRS